MTIFCAWRPRTCCGSAVTQPIDAVHVLHDGRTYVNFASNNYLGLTHHPDLIDAAQKAVAEFGAGSGAAPLVTGYGPAHQACEQRIVYGKEPRPRFCFPAVTRQTMPRFRPRPRWDVWPAEHDSSWTSSPMRH